MAQPPSRNRVERSPDRFLASVTDIGKVYSVNEDDVRIRKVTIESTRVSIMVVCDGVSSGQNSDIASSIGVASASNYLQAHLALGGDPREAMRLAILEADSSIRQIPFENQPRNVSPPGSTIVAAVALRKRLIVGWVGDSRCYLIDRTGARLLTHDHSWVNAVVASGSLTHEQALKAPLAHQITRCLGRLHGNHLTDIAEPGIVVCDLPDTGAVVLCTDGLSGYLPSPSGLARRIKIGPDAPDALTQARELVDFALASGGRDNVTVAVMLR